MSRILVISLTDLARDPRVDRQIEFLRSAHEVVAAGLGPPVDNTVEFIDLQVPFRRRPAELARQARSLGRTVAHRYLSLYWHHPLNLAASRQLAGHRADLVIANDLGALPLACRVAAGAPVIFDAHELSTDEHAERLWWRTLMAPYADALLRHYLPRTAGVMTVGVAIADVYAERYGVEPVVVTNAPPEAQLTPTPTEAPIRLIHHGGARPERRLELMIEAMDLLDRRFELDLILVRNQPRYFTRLKRLVDKRACVRLIEPVSQRDIVRRINRYDIGVYVLPPLSRNQLLALPNKVFEFIQARLATAVGPSPEMARIVRGHHCGVVTKDFTSRGLAEALRDLTPERVADYKQHAHRAASVLNAEHNRGIMLTLVDSVLTR
jgi:hypothetical protein